MKPLPVVSAVASWVDTFKLPLREIKAKYTKSDLTLLAWDSRLKSYNMHVGFKKPSVTTVQNSAKSSSVSDVPEGFVSPRGIQETETAYVLPDGVNNGMPIPKKAFDEDGELDLRRLSGDQGAAYIRGLGIPLAVIPRGVN